MARKKLNRTTISLRVAKTTPQKLKAIALLQGFSYNGGGATGEFLDYLTEGLASGEIVLVKNK